VSARKPCGCFARDPLMGPWHHPKCGYFQEAAEQTDDGAAAPGPELGGAPPARPEASEVVSGTVPSSPRRFQLWRHRDPSGVSGTGLIAEGTQWRDGTVSLRWYGDHPSTVAWPSVADIVAVHGHQGATELVWLDDEPIDLWPTEGGPP